MNDREAILFQMALSIPVELGPVFTALVYGISINGARGSKSWLCSTPNGLGMIPHIVFRHNDPDYFPGPTIWDTNTEPPTSGHSQPPY